MCVAGSHIRYAVLRVEVRIMPEDDPTGSRTNLHVQRKSAFRSCIVTPRHPAEAGEVGVQE